MSFGNTRRLVLPAPPDHLSRVVSLRNPRAAYARPLGSQTKKETALDDIWDDSASIPFWGRIEQLEKLSALASHCLETVNKSESPREMVLETWLVLDYAVRDLIVNSYGLYKFCQEDFDLRYELLPQSFRALLRFLKTRFLTRLVSLRNRALLTTILPIFAAVMAF